MHKYTRIPDERLARVVWYYNLWSQLTESRAARKALDLAEIKNGDAILEVATGTGMVFAELVKRNKKGLGCRPVSMHPYLTEAGFSNIEAMNISQNTFPAQVLKAEVTNVKAQVS